MKLWINNTRGKPDAVLTMTLMGFIVVLIKVLLIGFSIKIGSDVYSFGSIDAATIGALLTPTFGAYVARRYTDKKYDSRNDTKVAKLSDPTEKRDDDDDK